MRTENNTYTQSYESPAVYCIARTQHLIFARQQIIRSYRKFDRKCQKAKTPIDKVKNIKLVGEYGCQEVERIQQGSRDESFRGVQVIEVTHNDFLRGAKIQLKIYRHV